MTAITTDYLPFASVMADSLHRHHPDTDCFAAVVDATSNARPEASFTAFSLDELPIPNLRQWRFAYSRVVAPSAVKPYLLEYLLDRGYERAVFIDADMLVLGDLAALLSPVSRPAITLTPHLAAPPRGRTAEQELRILRAGVFNGGCIGVGGKAESRRFLDWWKRRLRHHCRHDMASGMHFDQRWLDLVPSMFEGVAIERDVGINVAYWNVDARQPREENGRWWVNGKFCRLAHFSGFDPRNPTVVGRHVPGLAVESLGEFANLLRHYAALLTAAGYGQRPFLPYQYDVFDNGVKIPAVVRDIYLDLGDRADKFGDPFVTEGPGSFFSWLQSSAQVTSGTEPAISHLWEAICRRRPDVQIVYPHAFGSDREAFVRWTQQSGVREHELVDWPPPRNQP